MPAGKAQYSVLVVSASDKVFSSVLDLMPPAEYNPVLRAKNSGEARRMLLDMSADIIIINTPLPDDFGVQLALDLSDSSSGILMLVKSDLYEQVAYRVEDSGIFTLPKPNSSQMIYNAVKLLSVYAARLKKLEQKNRTMQEILADYLETQSVNAAAKKNKVSWDAANKVLKEAGEVEKKLEQKNRTMQEKMTDIRTINRAKWLLIENLNMSENDAHRYIEKQAMDTRSTRREVAEGIIRTYDN